MREKSDVAEVWDFILEKAPEVMPLRRAKIYRGTARIIGNELDAAALNALAERCVALERDCAQLKLSFEQGDTAP